MAVRQYIGARYVPKFFDNNGSSDWVSGVAYEPLTIVTYLGNSYTSKIPVPANVGSPNSNPTYWAQTGIYNSQVEEYREQVEALQDDVDEISDDVETLNDFYSNAHSMLANWDVNTNGKVLFLGDSYGKLNTYDWLKWPDRVAQFLGLGTEGTNWWNLAQPSTGLAAGHFITFLQNWVEAHPTEADNIGAIICCGGINDSQSTLTGVIGEKLSEITTYVHTNIPNAVMYLGFIGWLDESIRTSDQRTATYRYQAIRAYMACASRGWKYLTGVENICHDKSLLTDGVHPTEAGETVIAAGIVNALTQGGTNCIYKKVPTVDYSGATVAGNFEQQLASDWVVTKVQGLDFTFAEDVTMAVGSTYTFGTVDLNLTNGVHIDDITITAKKTDGGNANILMNARLAVNRTSKALTITVRGYSDGASTHEIARLNAFYGESVDLTAMT